MAAVRREGAVAVEVAPGGGVDAAQRLAPLEVDHHREGARTAREDHALRGRRAKRRAVAPAGKGNVEDHLAIGAKPGREIALDLVGAATDVERPGAAPRDRRPEAQADEQAAGQARQEGAAAEVRGPQGRRLSRPIHQSPSMALKPTSRPSAGASSCATSRRRA